MHCVIAGVTSLLLGAGIAGAQTVDEAVWSANGQVSSAVRAGGSLYIAGNFTYIGPATGAWVAIDAVTGASRIPSAKVESGVGPRVYAAASDGSGGWYIGGSFTVVRGQSRNNLAHIDAGGNVTPWNPGSNDYVYALAVSGGTVYAGGTFTSIGGQSRSRIAALDASSGAATAWDPGANGRVAALVASGATVYAGGEFTSMGGQPRNYVAAVGALSGAATAWDPNANGQVATLVESGGTIYVGGAFTNIGGQSRTAIAALDVTSGAATAWSTTITYGFQQPIVHAIAVSGSTVYFGGEFLNVGGQIRTGTAAVDVITGSLQGWNPGAQNTFALTVSGNTVYLGGGFAAVGNEVYRNRLAAVDAVTGDVTAWDPNAGGVVYTLAVSGSTVYAGGTYNSVGGKYRSYVAKLDAATGIPTAWDAHPDFAVNAVVVNGGTVYAGGFFGHIGGQSRTAIAALDTISGAATAWNPDPRDTLNNGVGVGAIATSGTTVYVAGSFRTIGGRRRYRVAALDAATGLATDFDARMSLGGGPFDDPSINVFLRSGLTLYVGGNFSSIGGLPRTSIAALDAVTGNALAWYPSPVGGNVWAMQLAGSTLYVGGLFTNIGGQPRNRIAALDVATAAATAWNPNANDWVRSLTVIGSNIVVGGLFTSIGGQPRNRIAALNAANGAATPWDPKADSYVLALAVGEDGIYAGGTFTHIGGLYQPCLAKMSKQYLLAADGNRDVTNETLSVGPNPTLGPMRIQYEVTRTGRVRLQLLDVAGRIEATLVDRVLAAGRHAATWEGAGWRGSAAPGLYFVRLSAPDQVAVRKVALIR